MKRPVMTAKMAKKKVTISEKTLRCGCVYRFTKRNTYVWSCFRHMVELTTPEFPIRPPKKKGLKGKK